MVGISKRSVVKAISEGRIKASTTAGGHYRISLTEARRFMSRRGLDTSRDRFVGDLLADVLGRAGAEVLQSDCLFEAGAMTVKSRPWLIIVDAASAGPDPIALCRSVARGEASRGASILVLTGGDAAERERFRAAGAHGVLGKPFSVKQLKETLRDLGFSTGSFGRVGR